jgi:hypothetical protein
MIVVTWIMKVIRQNFQKIKYNNIIKIKKTYYIKIKWIFKMRLLPMSIYNIKT